VQTAQTAADKATHRVVAGDAALRLQFSAQLGSVPAARRDPLFDAIREGVQLGSPALAWLPVRATVLLAVTANCFQR
jgi:hypothetical protein